MPYNRIGTPKFYLDAVLLARKLGYIETENEDGLFYLNPTKTKSFEFEENDTDIFKSITFTQRQFINSLTHVFYLGHDFASNDISFRIKHEANEEQNFFDGITVSNNGWHKESFSSQNDIDNNTLTAFFGKTGDSNSFSIGDISAGWSYEMPHSPDMELTQTFANESLKVQTTKGGHTLTSTGWNQPPKWGIYPQWKRSPNNIAYPARRSWSLKFSYLADENSDNSGLMPQYYNELDVNNNNRGIFERITTDSFSIKDDFLSKVMPTINSGLPFIFSPNKDVEEYAICRVNANSVTMNQVANNVYDMSLDIVEVW